MELEGREVIGKRKTARPWAKRGVQGTELLQGIPGAIPKVEKEKRKVARTRKEVSKNEERADQNQFEQFLRKTWISYSRIPDAAYRALFGAGSNLSDGVRAYLSSYLAGLPDTFVFFRIGETPYLLARAIEQKVKGRHMDHRQQLKAAAFGTTECQTVEAAIKATLEARDMRDRFAAFLASEQKPTQVVGLSAPGKEG